MEKIKKNCILKISLTIAYILLVAVLYYLKVPCLFKQFFGIECFGCGMTRAVISALKLNFIEAFNFHPMFWSVPILYVYIIKDGKLFKNKTVNISCLVFIGIGFLLNWLIKIL